MSCLAKLINSKKVDNSDWPILSKQNVYPVKISYRSITQCSTMGNDDRGTVRERGVQVMNALRRHQIFLERLKYPRKEKNKVYI